MTKDRGCENRTNRHHAMLTIPASYVSNYFFLYPAGHAGLTAVTFLVSLPLVQVIVLVLLVDTVDWVGFGVAFTDADGFFLFGSALGFVGIDRLVSITLRLS
jgi:hypothetical protein